VWPRLAAHRMVLGSWHWQPEGHAPASSPRARSSSVQRIRWLMVSALWERETQPRLGARPCRGGTSDWWGCGVPQTPAPVQGVRAISPSPAWDPLAPKGPQSEQEGPCWAPASCAAPAWATASRSKAVHPSASLSPSPHSQDLGPWHLYVPRALP